MKNASPAEPLHRSHKLKWDHKVNLIGEKVVDPLVHNCEKCSLPILIYGRMLPCKHIFCYACAKKTEKHCPRCNGAISRIEQSALGTVFVCTVGGTKHGTAGCHRTYLSQRDLQSHIAHRHMNRPETRHQEPVVGPINQSEALQLHQTSPGAIHQSLVASGPPPHQLEFIATAPGIPAAQIQYDPSQPPPQIHDPGLVYHHPVQQRPLEELRLQMPHPQGPPPPLSTMAPPPMILPHGMKPQNLLPPLAIAQQVMNPPPGMSPRLTTVSAQGMALPPMQPPPQGLGHGITLHAMSQGHMPSGTTTHGSENFRAIPVMASRSTNLITVPIQDEGSFHRSEPPRSVAYHDASGMYQAQGGPPLQSGQHYPPGSHSVPKPCVPQGSQVAFTSPPPGHAPQYMSQGPPPPHHLIARPAGAPMGHPPLRAGPPVNMHSGPPTRSFPSPHHQYDEQHSSFGQPPGSSSPRLPWPPGAPPQRVPPPQRPQGSSGSMGPPHSLPFFQ